MKLHRMTKLYHRHWSNVTISELKIKLNLTHKENQVIN